MADSSDFKLLGSKVHKNGDADKPPCKIWRC